MIAIRRDSALRDGSLTAGRLMPEYRERAPDHAVVALERTCFHTTEHARPTPPRVDPRQRAGRQQEDNAPKEDDGSPKPEVVDARIYTRLWWVMGLAFGILGLGGAFLFRRGAA